jgi:hypothetical protein
VGSPSQSTALSATDSGGIEAGTSKYANSTVVLRTSFSAIMRERLLILASAPSILAAAVDGTLAQRLLADEELQREYTMVYDKTRVQPSIYVQLLTDVNGIAPTANQYLMIRERVLELHMNLTEDICSYLYVSGQTSQHFCMHQFEIYLIFRLQQAAIAEIFCSGLLQVRVEDGGGTSSGARRWRAITRTTVTMLVIGIGYPMVWRRLSQLQVGVPRS